MFGIWAFSRARCGGVVLAAVCIHGARHDAHMLHRCGTLMHPQGVLRRSMRLLSWPRTLRKPRHRSPVEAPTEGGGNSGSVRLVARQIYPGTLPRWIQRKHGTRQWSGRGLAAKIHGSRSSCRHVPDPSDDIDDRASPGRQVSKAQSGPTSGAVTVATIVQIQCADLDPASERSAHASRW